jgi:hypothetical protein
VIYREFLVMRKALLWYFGIIAAVASVFIASISWRQTLMCGQHTTVSSWLLSSAATAMVFTAIFGVGLGNASREGARIFWVLPQGRLRSGLALICVDLIAGVGALVITFIGSLIVMTAGIAIQHTSCVVTNDLDVQKIAVAVGFPLAVYGWCTLTGMLLRRVAYMGVIFFPLGLLWLAFSQAENEVGDFLRSIAFANPFNMFKEMAALPLWGIAIATVTIALVLWQRADVVA